MTSKIRVLHLAKFYSPRSGGMERVLQLLCESTADAVENYVVAAHTSLYTVHEVVGGIRVTRVGRVAQAGSVAVCPAFPLWASRAHADLTVLHVPNAPALAAECLARSTRPLIVWYHADLVRPRWIYDALYRPLLNRALQKASRIITSSPMLARSEDLREVRDKCVVVPFGVDPAALERSPTVPEWLGAFRARTRAPMALMVGRMVPYKGVDVLLRALVDTKIATVVVGSGPQLARYQRLAATLGLGDRVLFAGHVSDLDLIAAYHRADFLVLPSVTRQEAFGIVQLEAMACGKPVVSTNLSTGVPWVNQDRQTGLVVPPGDVGALRAALLELAHNAPLRQRLGIAARQRVLRDFTLEQARSQTLSVYRQVVDNGRSEQLLDRSA